MRKRYTAQNLYKTTLVNPVNGISASGDGDTVFTIVVADTPSTDLTEGFLVIDYNQEAKRDFIKFHAVSGTTFSYYRKDRDLLSNGSLTLRHDPGAFVQINVVMEYHEHLYDNLDDFGYIEDFWTNNFKVYGGIVDTPGGQATIADTSFSSVADGTRYVFFDYADNTFKLLASTSGYYGLSVATVVVASGDISSITDTRPMVMPTRYDSDVFEIGADGELKLVNNTTISDATTASKGRVRLGTLSDHQSLTAAAVVVQTSNLVKTPDATPSNDENKVPILSSEGYIDSFISPVGKRGYVGASSAGSDTYVVTPYSPVTPAKGVRISFEADVGNTGAATLNLGGGAVTITHETGETLYDGAIRAGDIVQLYHNGTNWVLEGVEDYLIFGDGRDGDVTISSNTTLTRDMYYNNLTISNTFTLYPDGYKIYVRGTLTNNGTISRNGNAGADGDDGDGISNSGGAGGAALNAGTLNDSIAGGDGGGGNENAAGSAGVASADATNSYSANDGSDGGAGVASAGYAGGAAGAGGTTTRGTYYNTVLTTNEVLAGLSNPASFNYRNLSSHTGPSSGGGGGAGGGEAGSGGRSGGAGGGGGSSAGVIWIAARVIDNTSGTIEAIGGAGGAGGDALAFEAGGSGGGGGNGGVIYLIYKTLTAIGTTTLTAGAAGAAGAAGSGNAGNAGVAGTAGDLIQIPL